MQQGVLLHRVIAAATPIALSYIPIGLACGVLGSKCGIGPGAAAVLSATIISGGAQFMISNMWLAGLPAATIVASVCAVSLRFALYSASLAPYLQRARKRTALAMALTLIEEGYGVTLAKLADGDRDWTFRHAFALNVITIATWVASVAAGRKSAAKWQENLERSLWSLSLAALLAVVRMRGCQGGDLPSSPPLRSPSLRGKRARCSGAASPELWLTLR